MSSIEFFCAESPDGYVIAEWVKEGGYRVRSKYGDQPEKILRYAFGEKAIAAAQRKAKRLGIPEGKLSTLVTRKSLISGKVTTMDLPINEDQITEYLRGALIQDAFPNLTPSQREFILSGITPEEWDAAFGDNDDDDDDEEEQ